MNVLIVMNSVVGEAEQIGFSGSTVVATNHARVLKKMGVKVSFLTTLEGMRYLRKNQFADDVYITSCTKKKHHSFISYLFNFIKSLKYLKENYDEIYSVSDLLPDAFWTILYSFKKDRQRRRIIGSCHLKVRTSLHPTESFIRHAYSFIIQKIILWLYKKRCDYIVVPNKLLADYIGHKAVCVYGAGTYRVRNTREKFYDVVFVGNDQTVKGFEILDYLKQYFRITEIGDRTKRMEGVSKVAVMSFGRLLLLPSYQESFSLVAIEAMSVGLPVVAFDTPVMRSIYTKGMIFVPEWDKYRMQYVIHRLLTGGKVQGKTLEEHSQDAWDLSKGFSWQKAGEQIYGLLS